MAASRYSWRDMPQVRQAGWCSAPWISRIRAIPWNMSSWKAPWFFPVPQNRSLQRRVRACRRHHLLRQRLRLQQRLPQRQRLPRHRRRFKLQFLLRYHLHRKPLLQRVQLHPLLLLRHLRLPLRRRMPRHLSLRQRHPRSRPQLLLCHRHHPLPLRRQRLFSFQTKRRHSRRLCPQRPSILQSPGWGYGVRIPSRNVTSSTFGRIIHSGFGFWTNDSMNPSASMDVIRSQTT